MLHSANERTFILLYLSIVRLFDPSIVHPAIVARLGISLSGNAITYTGMGGSPFAGEVDQLTVAQKTIFAVGITLTLLYKRLNGANMAAVFTSRSRAFASTFGPGSSASTATKMVNACGAYIQDHTSMLSSLRPLQEAVLKAMLKHAANMLSSYQAVCSINLKYCEYYNMSHVRFIEKYLINMDHPVLFMKSIRPELNNYRKFLVEYKKLGPLACFCKIFINPTLDSLINTQNFRCLTEIAHEIGKRIDARLNNYNFQTDTQVIAVVTAALELHDSWLSTSEGNKNIKEYSIMLDSRADDTEYENLIPDSGLIGTVMV